jgi:chromosome segregation ATPase
VQERVQEAETNGSGDEEKAKAGPTKSNRTSGGRSGGQHRAKSGRFERKNGDEVDTDLSPRALLTRLEQQSGQLGILRSKLDETRKALEREREAAQAANAALEEERRNRERVEGNLTRERSARQQAEDSVEESRATASALEAQHHLLRAQLKALEHKSARRRFPLGRGR